MQTAWPDDYPRPEVREARAKVPADQGRKARRGQRAQAGPDTRPSRTNADFHAANSTLLRTDLLLVSDGSAQVDGFGRYRATRHRWVISPSCHLRRACACWPVVGDLARKHDLSPFACLNAVAICCRTCAQRGGNDPITSAMKRLRSEIALRAGRDRLVVCARSCTSGASHCPRSRVTVASTSCTEIRAKWGSYRTPAGKVVYFTLAFQSDPAEAGGQDGARSQGNGHIDERTRRAS